MLLALAVLTVRRAGWQPGYKQDQVEVRSAVVLSILSGEKVAMINSTVSTQVPRTFKINLFNYIFITWTSSIHLRMEVKLLVESAVLYISRAQF